MTEFQTSTIRLLTRRFWGVIFTLIIAFAVVVQLGREAFPLLKEYNEELSQRLSEQLGVELSIGALEAEWEGMRPRLDLYDVLIRAEDGETIFKIAKAQAEIDLLDSLFQGRLYWQRILMEDMEASAYQDENKTWHITGLETTSQSTSNFQIDDPLDIFLFGRQVEIKNLNLEIRYRTGHRSQLSVPDVSMENDRDFHRLEASLKVDENDQAFRFLVEGWGDPRDAENFTAKGYMEFSAFPMEKVLAASGLNVWDDEENQTWREGHNLDMQLWFSGSRHKGIEAKGQLRADGLPLNLPEYLNLPQQFKSEIFARWKPNERWALWFNDAELSWPEFELPVFNVLISRNAGEAPHLRTQNIEVEDWLRHIDDLGLGEQLVGKILKELQPKGNISTLDVEFLADDDRRFLLQAELQQAQTEAFRGSPKIGKVNAFVRASALEGDITLLKSENLALYFPQLYKHTFNLENAQGQVAWKVDLESKRTLLSSSLLKANTGTEDVHGKLYLALPFKREYGEPWMTLSLGVEKTAAKNYQKFLPGVVPEGLSSWLARSVGKGELSNVRFIYSGSVRKQGKLAKNIQLLAAIDNGVIAFDKAWPPLEKVKADIYLNDRDLNVNVYDASILDNHVAAARISLLDNPKHDYPDLSIKGLIRGDAKAALTLLQNSPVRNAIGETFDTWKVKGDVSADLELIVPLTEDQSDQKQNVRVDFARAQLDITDLDLVLKEVTGSLFYRDDAGLYTDDLQGRLWGERIKARVSSPKNAEQRRETQLNFEGNVGIEPLYKWTKRPELLFAEGKAFVEGQLRIPASSKDKSSDDVRKVAILMESGLQGVQLNLPRPVGKALDVEKPFSVNIDVFADHQTFSFNFDKWIKLNILRGSSEVNSAQILFGDKELEAESGFFDVAGNIESFDLQEWNKAREKYFEYLGGRSEAEGKALPIRFDLSVARSNFGSFEVQDVDIAGIATEGDWTLYVDSKFIRGTLVAYESGRPLFMGLEHIRFPEVESDVDPKNPTVLDSEEERKSILADVDLSLAVPIDFVAKEISVGNKNYGRWQFDFKPIENGVHFDNIQADIRGLKIGSETEPADFEWTQINGVNHSRFEGTITSGNIADVLEAWEQDRLMESQSANIHVAAHWPGAPDEVELKTIEGVIKLYVENGNFVRGAKAGENPLLRLIALFNFDTLARRLRLDFSDLAKQGFAFDSVAGEFNFAEGLVHISSPLIVESTSSRMQLTGVVDVINEEINSELIVTLPVASNIAVLTAFTAGLPAGLGVYLISKVFKKQVDKVSSINYSVTGNWNSPKIKVRKVLKDSEPNKEFGQGDTVSQE